MHRALLQRYTALLWRCMNLVRKYRNVVDMYTAFCGDTRLNWGYHRGLVGGYHRGLVGGYHTGLVGG